MNDIETKIMQKRGWKRINARDKSIIDDVVDLLTPKQAGDGLLPETSYFELVNGYPHNREVENAIKHFTGAAERFDQKDQHHLRVFMSAGAQYIKEGTRPTSPADGGGAIAKLFHQTYERLAPSFGYETRKESAKPWEEVPEKNKRLMIAVCNEVSSALTQPAPEPKEDAEAALEKLRAWMQTFTWREDEKDLNIFNWDDFETIHQHLRGE